MPLARGLGLQGVFHLVGPRLKPGPTTYNNRLRQGISVAPASLPVLRHLAGWKPALHKGTTVAAILTHFQATVRTERAHRPSVSIGVNRCQKEW